MQTRSSVHIASTEWRWVILTGCALVLLAFLPLLWVAVTGTGDWQFMGTLHNYLDGATYLSKMTLGLNGEWMVVFQHTPESHTGAFIQIVYPLLGHLARLAGIPLIVMFHVARVFSSLFMYAALYQLGASIWIRVRTRRVFFIVAALGSGLGWVFAPLMQLSIFPDFPLLPEAYPFFSTLVNVHFPLTIACLALLAGLFITVFRPGAEDDPSLTFGWLPVAFLSLSLAALYPQALVPIGASIIVFAAILFLHERRLSPLLLRWLLALVLPPVPYALYYFSIVTYNPIMAEWNSQNVTASPPLWAFLVGFGLPLLIGLPAIYRSVRRFERDGDRSMLLWLVCILIAVYLPSNVQRRFAVGMMLPVAYFATRAIEDVWLARVHRRWRKLLFAVFVPVIALSQLLMLFFPVLPILTGMPERAVGVFLPREYRDVYDWLNAHTQSDDVILASPVVSAWLPGWADTRVVFGHPYETMDAETKLLAVGEWYAGNSDCTALLDAYQVRYVLYGPEEARLGSAPCLDAMNVVARSDDVAIYAP